VNSSKRLFGRISQWIRKSPAQEGKRRLGDR